MPRYKNFKPDFQAPGPRVLIEETIKIDEDDEEEDGPDYNNEIDEVSTYGPPKTRYYESKKVLGKLYRAIDETQFFEQLQTSLRKKSRGEQSLLGTVWEYVKVNTALIQWQHLIEFAKDVKERYVSPPDEITQTDQHPSY